MHGPVEAAVSTRGGAELGAAHGERGRASVVDLTFALWALVIPLGFGGMLVNGDGDLARHLVTGRYILAHGPRFADPFSFTRGGDPFLAYEWLSQALLAAVHGWLGLAGVVVLSSLLLATSFALVVRWVRAAGDPWLAFMVGTAAVVLTYPHWLARPHLFSFLGLAALLYAIESPRRTLWLGVLFALWANLHPGFLYGLVMLGAWSSGMAVEDVRSGDGTGRAVVRWGVPVLVASAATLLNPFGAALHVHALALGGGGSAMGVSEFLPLPLLSINGLVFLAVAGTAAAGLALARPARPWPAVLPFTIAVAVSFMGRRYTTLLPLFALPLAARALAPAMAALPHWLLGRMRAEFARSDRPGSRHGSMAAAGLALLLVVGRVGGPGLLPDRFSPHVFPEAAVRVAMSQQLDGRLISEYTWGGYVLYAWPGQRVFVDSMADFFGPELIGDYVVLRDARPGWRNLLARNRISVVLFPPGTPIVEALRGADGWRVVHEDGVAVLLAKNGEGG